MSAGVEEPAKQTAASLLSGILGDLQQLIEQQFQLTRREIEDELRQRATAGAVFGLGIGGLFLGVVLLCLSLVHLLHWAASPAGADPAWLPLWACHAVAAVAIVVIGGILTYVGLAKFNAVEPFQNPATELMQEHVPWTTPQK